MAGLLPQQRGPGHLVAKRPLRRQPLPLPRCGQERGALREADGGVGWPGKAVDFPPDLRALASGSPQLCRGAHGGTHCAFGSVCEHVPGGC